ncbi:MAG: hypothetical protein H8D78_00565 [Chloroflexi bacterium]|nr:hypothetical protein [Chloroflexota bacterium]
MPNWQPNWNNVVWDWGAADWAIHALRHAAERLGTTAHDRRHAAEPAQRQWRGCYREQFDQQLAGMVCEERRLADECRDAAGRVARASQMARDEQNRREADRRRWWEEKREEERRKREREEARRRRS